MKSDKKNKSDSINLILIRNFGKLNLSYQAKSDELSKFLLKELNKACLLYTSPSPRDPNRSRMPSSA